MSTEQYIQKSVVVAKIDRQIELLKPFLGACAGQIVAEANAKLSVLEGLKNFLDTLEVKEVDLEKELDSMITPELKFHKALPSLFDVAKHFFELSMIVGNKAQKGEQVDYGKLQTSLDDALSKETKESWDKFLQEEPVSTKDKLLALSDGRLQLGWIDDAKVVEFEECLMQFHEDMNNIPQGTDSLTRLKDTDGVLHSYSKKLMSMAKEESISEYFFDWCGNLVKEYEAEFDKDFNL